MAANAPPSNAEVGWSEKCSSGMQGGQKNLEIGMSGMSLVSGLGQSNSVSRPPTLTGSIVSAATTDEPSSSRNPSYGSISLPSADPGVAGIGRGTPPSPMSPLHKNLIGNLPHLPKPPGINFGPVSLPSPIGKGSATNTTGASSPTNLSLTPNSSMEVHGETFTASFARQGSPSPMGETRSATPAEDKNLPPWNEGAGTGSIVEVPNDYESSEDGLHGLGALRERSRSSPGPFAGSSIGGMLSASSPPVTVNINSASSQQGDMSPLNPEIDASRQRSYPLNPRHTRGPSNGSGGSFGGGRHSRPPLSGGIGSYASLADSYDATDRFLGSGGGGRSRLTPPGDISPYESDTNQSERNRIEQGALAQKFGSLSNLDTHMRTQTNRLPPHTSHHQHGRHVRSSSHSEAPQESGFLSVSSDESRLASSYDGRHERNDGGFLNSGRDGFSVGISDAGSGQGNSLYSGSSGMGMSRSISDGHGFPGSHGGSPVMHLSTSLSLQALGSSDSHGTPPGLSRRNSDGFQGSYGGPPAMPVRHQLTSNHSQVGLAPRYDDSPVMATAEEMRLYGIGSHGRSDSVGLSSPYSNHSHNSAYSRRHSELSNQLSSSPIGMAPRPRGQSFSGSTGDLRHNMGHIPLSQSAPRGLSALDDDLTHPLAGELIDDPNEEIRYSRVLSTCSVPPQLGLGGGSYGHAPSHHIHRHHHSGHMDRSPTALSPHYVDSHHHHLPTAGATYSVPRQVYNVKFKRTQRNFVLAPRFRGDLKIGCYVKVEADRGEDLGIVVGKIPGEKFNGPGRSSFRGSDMMGSSSSLLPGGISDLKRITRLATHDEVSLLSLKREEEDDLLKVCRAKVHQRALPMTVVDAEYQFDRHKLTFFFEAEGRIDFRELVRDLFSMYKTRIWMQQLDKNGPSSGPGAGYLSGLPDYRGVSGTPIPVMADLTDQFASTSLGGGMDSRPPH